MDKQGPLLLLGLIGIGALIASAGANNAQAGSGGPGRPVAEGGEVVLRGFKSNPQGVKISFQIEKLPDGQFAGIIFEPWNGNNPALVGDGATREAARDATLAFIDANQHGGLGG